MKRRVVESVERELKMRQLRRRGAHVVAFVQFLYAMVRCVGNTPPSGTCDKACCPYWPRMERVQ